MSDPSSIYSKLSKAVQGHAAALRSISRLQPIGGLGDKIFPATYSGGVYATEKRRQVANDPASPLLNCVLIDSVQSQANRAEEALLEAIRRGNIEIPLIEVDFSKANEQFLVDVPNLTSLDVPHRLADAILRDSETAEGIEFSKSDYAKKWAKANLWNATAVYELCPTALVFGMWGSPEKPGGLGAKFERAFVSEIAGIGVAEAEPEKRVGFRIDPLNASSHVLLTKTEAGFVIAGEKGKNSVKPSEMNHGNVPHESKNSGIRVLYAEQNTVVSLGALRKLKFPINGINTAAVDDAGRTVLAALAVCAAVLASERGTSLRSRCQLVPEAPRQWELIAEPGQVPEQVSIDGEAAIALLKEAIAAAEALGLTWMKKPLKLKPTKRLVELVQKSQQRQATKGELEELLP